MKLAPIVMVDWVDAAAQSGWDGAQNYDESLDCVSTGFLVHKAKDRIVLALNYSVGKGRGDYGEFMTIPKSAVRKVRTLEKGRQIASLDK